jgi:hypothetical protein
MTWEWQYVLGLKDGSPQNGNRAILPVEAYEHS